MSIKPIPGIPLYGNQKFRDKKCPIESMEQMTFISRIRAQYQNTYGRALIHPENEGKLINGQFVAINKSRAMGMTKGSSDIIIPGSPAFVCELKRKDRTLSVIDQDQIDYLYAAKVCGAFVCVALGCDAAMDAFNDWLKINNKVDMVGNF